MRFGRACRRRIAPLAILGLLPPAGVTSRSIAPQAAPPLKADPPRIFRSTTPAVLVGFDGQPVWSPIEGVADLRYAVNTNWDVFAGKPARAFYLRHGASWLTASQVEGPWTPAVELPASFARLPADDNWKEVKAHLPGKAFAAGKAPAVFVSFAPAELILLDGPPRYEPVAGTRLSWVANTESDLFRLGARGPFYYLVAGRWFSAPGLDGPWTFATPELPADFRAIPPEHPRSRVLASVPGTDQAAAAVRLAGIPRTARVDVRQMRAPEVSYQGGPRLELIAGTSLARAVNTDKDVVRAGDVYYLCFQGVWFKAPSATGPWEVASAVPPEIYGIPPSSPIHHVTYVTVQDGGPGDGRRTFSYLPGYEGVMVAWGCAVWGTGWSYPPAVSHGGRYPAYFQHPSTYGLGAWYNPRTGTYGRAGSAYGPYGGAGAAAVYDPRSGTLTRGAAAYGPYDPRAVAEAWNPRRGGDARNLYDSWGTSR